MNGLDTVASRLPIVLVVDPVTASRHAMWRLLSHSFGVLEAPDARRAREWLARRPDIAALVVQKDLPDADGGELVGSLVQAHSAAASRAIMVSRPVDLGLVIRSLVAWFFARDGRKARELLREADRLVS